MRGSYFCALAASRPRRLALVHFAVRGCKAQKFSRISDWPTAAAEYKLDSAAGLPYAEEAVKLNPSVPSAHYLLGLLYLDTDNYQKAIPELEKAQTAFPKDAKICFALGSAYARAGRKEDAKHARAAFVQLRKESESSSDVTH